MSNFIKIVGSNESERINFDLIKDYNRNKNTLMFFYLGEDDECNYVKFRNKKHDM